MKWYVKYSLTCFLFATFSACKHQQKINKESNNIKNEHLSHSLKKKYAELLGISESAVTNQKLYQFINDWYGVPYKYAGKDKEGIDCSGLTSMLYTNVYQKKNIPVYQRTY